MMITGNKIFHTYKQFYNFTNYCHAVWKLKVFYLLEKYVIDAHLTYLFFLKGKFYDW